MKIRDLPGHWHAKLMQSKLWERDVSSLSELDTMAFMRPHQDRATQRTIAKTVDQLVEACWAVALEGTVRPIPRVCFFHVPVPRITLGEFRERLIRVSPVRRNAIVFALDTGLVVQQVVDLYWKTLPRVAMTDLAQTMAYQVPRHYKLPYVFWEAQPNGAAGPLIGLDESARIVADGKDWAHLRGLYLGAIPVDQGADLRDFLQEIGVRLPELNPARGLAN